MNYRVNLMLGLLQLRCSSEIIIYLLLAIQKPSLHFLCFVNLSLTINTIDGLTFAVTTISVCFIWRHLLDLCWKRFIFSKFLINLFATYSIFYSDSWPQATDVDVVSCELWIKYNNNPELWYNSIKLSEAKIKLKNITSYSPSSMFNRVFIVSEAVGQSDGSLEVNLSSKAGLE